LAHGRRRLQQRARRRRERRLVLRGIRLARKVAAAWAGHRARAGPAVDDT
jgi:hypothetical protein